MIALTLAIVASIATLPSHPGSEWARDRLLATPRPYPAARVDSPDRFANGRLWVSSWPVGTRTPAVSRTFYEPGAAHFGAPVNAQYDRMYVLLGGAQTIAISPWQRHAGNGFERLERARNIWLREQGLVLKVRTHVNARYIADAPERIAGAHPQPRATIHVPGRAPRGNVKLWASADEAAATVRIVGPRLLQRNLPPMVVKQTDSSIAFAVK